MLLQNYLVGQLYNGSSAYVTKIALVTLKLKEAF